MIVLGLFLLAGLSMVEALVAASRKQEADKLSPLYPALYLAFEHWRMTAVLVWTLIAGYYANQQTLTLF